MHIDFSYAFDTVNRDVIHNSLIKYNDPDKLIRLIKLTIQGNKIKVKINNN
jgi:Ran GTPase-activating protein (RanGAP) involved in mRNA processing and transport